MATAHARARALLAVASALAAGLVWLSVTSCTPATRYNVLTVLFTGVPPPGSKPEVEEPVKPAAPAAGARRAVVVKSSQYSHGPFATNQCFLCHQTSASGGLRGFGKLQAAQGSLAKAGAVSGQLVAPLGELCVSCHTGKSPQAAAQAGLWVHGPVNSGNCTLCHGAHSGPEPFLLPQKADALCTGCHADGLVAKSEAHADMRDCLSCHNPHWGRDRHLLKAELQEGS